MCGRVVHTEEGTRVNHRLKTEEIETFKSYLSTVLSLLEVESQAHTMLINDDGDFWHKCVTERTDTVEVDHPSPYPIWVETSDIF